MLQRLCILLSVIMLLSFPPLSAAETETNRQDIGPLSYLPSLAGDYFMLNSAKVGRHYHIFVRLPENYAETPDTQYPVVYLLDGDSLFPMIAPQHLFLTYDEALPEAIIVGIAFGGFGAENTRHLDFRSVMNDGSKGRAGQFLSMLEQELLPEVDRRFRTDPAHRIIIGQSRGGSAVLYAAWNAPGLFWGHVASNPAPEPDKLLYGMNITPPKKPQNGWLIVASGSRDQDHLRRYALQWRDNIGARNDLAWRTEFLDIDGGTHSASIGRVYREAMLLMLAN